MNKVKIVKFYGYIEDCQCSFCSAIRAIIEKEKEYHINSFEITDKDE